MQIYLDYSATTPPRPEVLAVMRSVMTTHWGNPSSLHHWGNRAATVLERSRLQVAELIHAPAESIVFTAGGTEANNLAIAGTAEAYISAGHTPGHIVVSSVEHSAVARPVRQLAFQGWQVSWLPVDAQGSVDPAALRAALRPDTVLVSVIYGQSEVGTLQPIEALGAIAQAHGSLFHTDAVQVAGRLPIDVSALPVDLLSLSSHKIYGPQGAGALYVSPRVMGSSVGQSRQLAPILLGGAQEAGLRSGTQALPAIAGFGTAAELAGAEMPTETLRLIHLRDRFFAAMADAPQLCPTGHSRHRLPHHVSFRLADDLSGSQVTGKTLVRQMNLAGIGISAGSACHSGQLTPSSVLSAMGFGAAIAKSGIRLTLGKPTTEADVDWSAMVLKQVLSRVLPQTAAV